MSESHKQTSKDLNSMLRELQTLQQDIMDIILLSSNITNALHSLEDEAANSSNKLHFSLSLRHMVEHKLIRAKNGIEGFHSTVYSTVFFLSSLSLINLLSSQFGAYQDDSKVALKIIIDGNIFRDANYSYVDQARFIAIKYMFICIIYLFFVCLGVVAYLPSYSVQSNKRQNK